MRVKWFRWFPRERLQHPAKACRGTPLPALVAGGGRMVRGPQGIFAKVPGLDFGYLMLTRVLPLGRAAVTERDGELYIGG